MPELLFMSSTHTAMGMLVLSPVMQVKLLPPDDMPLVEMMSKDLSLEIWMAHFDSLKDEKAGALKWQVHGGRKSKFLLWKVSRWLATVSKLQRSSNLELC
jgi:hypothetical protein